MVRSHVPHYRKQIGLTLIEVLIALAIISIGMAAVIKTSTQNIHSTRYLQDKTIAMWVGLQVMNEARSGLFKMDRSSGSQRLTTKMLGRDWYWQTEQEDTPNQRIKKLQVKVFASEQDEEDTSPIITLEGYLYHEV